MGIGLDFTNILKLPPSKTADVISNHDNYCDVVCYYDTHCDLICYHDNLCDVIKYNALGAVCHDQRSKGYDCINHTGLANLIAANMSFLAVVL